MNYNLELLLTTYKCKNRKANIQAMMSELAGLLKEEEEKENTAKDQERIIQELADFLKRWKKDWIENSYSDKIHTPTDKITGKNKYRYEFENGDLFELVDNNIVITTASCIKTYTVNLFIKLAFINFANETIEYDNYTKKKRPSFSNYGDYKSSKDNTKHPKWETFNILITTISNRKDQLKTCRITDRAVMENELEAAINRMTAMKEKYGF